MTKGRDLFRKCYGIMYIIIIFNIFIAVESKSPSNRIKKSPTVYPVDRFDPINDAENLHEAMATFKADTETIVEVLTKRNLAQRLKIAETYKTHYGEDLKDNLNRTLYGIPNKVAMALMTPVPQYYAEKLHCAFEGLRTDKVSALEIFCTLNNSEIVSVTKAYEQMYHTTLETDLKKDHSFQFQRAMAPLIQADRDENAGVDSGTTMLDVYALTLADPDNYDADFAQFNRILMRRSYEQLRVIFGKYKRKTGHDIERKIKEHIHGLAQEASLTIVKCAKSKAGYFAEKLDAALDILQTNDSTLIYTIATRREIDLGEIKEAFFDKYGVTLESRIKDCTSGDYQKNLLSLIDNEPYKRK